jgi:putative transposase
MWRLERFPERLNRGFPWPHESDSRFLLGKGASHGWENRTRTIFASAFVAAIDTGHTREEVAERYNLALSTVGRFIRRKRETGSVEPGKFGGHKTFTLAPHADLVRALVAEQPDSTLAELKARLAKKKVKVSKSAISRFLHHLNLTFRKRAYTPRSKIGKTLSQLVRPCGKHNQPLIRNDLSSLMRPPPPPR